MLQNQITTLKVFYHIPVYPLLQCCCFYIRVEDYDVIHIASTLPLRGFRPLINLVWVVWLFSEFPPLYIVRNELNTYWQSLLGLDLIQLRL